MVLVANYLLLRNYANFYFAKNVATFLSYKILPVPKFEYLESVSEFSTDAS